jgi:hypothetical protein
MQRSKVKKSIKQLSEEDGGGKTLIHHITIQDTRLQNPTYRRMKHRLRGLGEN